MLNKSIKFFLENKPVTILLVLAIIVGGIVTSPFNWDSEFIPRNPVPIDAIPDTGDNQQIIYTEWKGRSPQDIEDQITYPLTTALLGISGVKTVRSSSIFGLSTIYLIFEDDIEFYWSRTRILEKLNALQVGILPDEVKPSLGPDATALGQVFWYTLEGRNPKTGEPTGGWDPHELRTIQDYYLRYALTSVKGVVEVASIGGFVKEYQIDIDPDAMKNNNVSVDQIMKAIAKSNIDIGARTLEFNKAEYLIRGLGYIKKTEDIEEAVIIVHNNVPIRVKDVAFVNIGPATRRGGLDKEGAEATGAVVISRYGANPMAVINRIKEKIKAVDAGLPSKVLADGTVSKVTVIPFYDRTDLIYETLGTLEEALSLEILISIIVVMVLVMNIRASILISSLLPIAVFMTFIAMKYFQVDANIVALSGIAIAIGVMIDVGVVLTENIIRFLNMPYNKGVSGKNLLKVIYEASIEVAPAVLTSLATTVVSFLPVFAMQATEGKLFSPLAYTKTFALIGALITGIIIIPSLAHLVFSIRFESVKKLKLQIFNSLLIVGAIIGLFYFKHLVLLTILGIGMSNLTETFLPKKIGKYNKAVNTIIILLTVTFFLTKTWIPLGVQNSLFINYSFVIIIVISILGVLMMVIYFYPTILKFCLDHKLLFFTIPVFVIAFGMTSWMGIEKSFGWFAFSAESVGWEVRQSKTWESLSKRFSGIGKEFMPALDEGAFLFMPTTMAHSGIAENIDVIKKLDAYISNIPEVELVVGKWGRVNSALDPAPISMFENIINYKPEFMVNINGYKMRFAVNENGAYKLKDRSIYNPFDNYKNIQKEDLIQDENGKYFRQWRDHIKKPQDIWNEILKVSKIPGMTSSPKLQPIQTRLIMLTTGMRTPIGIKIYGPNLETIENFGLQLEKILQTVPSIESSSVFADRIVGKPYMEFKINRLEIARYGLTISDVQTYIQATIGGIQLTTTIEGRERFPVRLRYAREFRDNPNDIKKILIPTPYGSQIPLGVLMEVIYRRGPQMIKSEDTFLTGYVIFDKKENYTEIDAVEQAEQLIKTKIELGTLIVPAGLSYRFTGNYENELRASKRLMIVIPVAMLIIFMILYLQFRSTVLAIMIFSGVFVAISGGFIMIWLYGQDWFLRFDIFGVNMQDLFQIQTINLSVAVWVGFIALMGIATDDGVLIGTYLQQVFKNEKPQTIQQVRDAVLHAGIKRVRPAVMTTATTIIALIPVLTATGKGSDIMIPMAIPSFGGMIIQVMTMFVVPVLYSMWKEATLIKIKRQFSNII